MKHSELLEENCAIARSFRHARRTLGVGDPPPGINGARRFEDFATGIGLARNILSNRWRDLVVTGGGLLRVDQPVSREATSIVSPPTPGPEAAS